MNKKKNLLMAALIVIIASGAAACKSSNPDNKERQRIPVSVTYSTEYSRDHWKQGAEINFRAIDKGNTGYQTIKIDESRKYQEFLGIGSSFEDSSIANLNKLNAEQRQEVLKMLVDPKEGAGFNLWRITLGTADFCATDEFYTYDDLRQGESDPDLKKFSIQKDIDRGIVRAIKDAQSINPNLKFFGSAWSAPGWMKTMNKIEGVVQNGRQMNFLKDEYIDTFAKYYAKAVQAFKAEGINLYSITELNEPGVPVTYPAMNMTVEQQRKLLLAIKREFNAASLDTKVWVHDFNFSDWRITPGIGNDVNIFEGPDSKEVLEAADGVAFHAYAGDPLVMNTVKPKYNKDVFLTETTVWGAEGAGRIMDFFRYNARSYNAWVTFLDQNNGVHHFPGGVGKTMVSVNKDGKPIYRYELYMMGQFTKFIKEGAVRVESTKTTKGLNNIVFRNPDGQMVLVVSNANSKPETFKVIYNGRELKVTISQKTVATYTWKA